MSDWKNNIFLKTTLVFAGLLLAVLSIGTTYFYRHTIQPRREAPDRLLQFTGLPQGTKGDIYYKTNKTTQKISFDKASSASLPNELREGFALPYTLTAGLTFPKGERLDLSWQIDRDGRQYFINLEGFSTADRFDFFLNDIEAMNNAGFDWSGKFHVRYVLLTDMDTTGCIKFDRVRDDFSVCHYLTGKK